LEFVITSISVGPKRQFLLGHLPDFARNPTDFLTRCARDYGDVVDLRLGPKRAVLLSGPAYIEDVLVTKRRTFAKPYRLRASRVRLSRDPGSSVHDLLPRSQLMRTAFHRNTVQGYGDTMVSRTEQMLATWRVGEIRDVQAEMMQLTLGIVASTLFGAEGTQNAHAVNEALTVVMESFLGRMRHMFLPPEQVPTPGNLRVRAARRQLNAVMEDMIEQWRTGRSDGGTMLSMLGDPTGENGQSIDFDRLRDESLTFLLAGHETVALSLTWALYLLSAHPSVENKLADEVAQVLGDRSPTAADWSRLTYTQMVVRESMRLYPPLWVVARVATENCDVGGRSVPAGTLALMSPWVMHRDPRFFPEPTAFKPERWEQDLERRLPRYAYFPFGGGARGCIGSGFAMLEAVLLLATMIQRVQLTLAPGQTVIPMPSITLRPGREFKMVVHARSRDRSPS
jgi:cytochrome P450